MLAINLRDLHQDRLQWDENVTDPAGVWPDIDARFTRPVRLSAEAQATPRGDVRVAGHLEAAVQVPCRRCLTEVEERLEIPLDLWFRREASDLEAEEQAVFALASDAPELDLVPALREELLLAIPTYPLCAEDCAGLCPRCGARRAEQECNCVLEEPDPRWDALRALR